MANRADLTDQGKLLFGAGFVFGVGTTLCLLAVVLVAVTQTPAGPGGPAGSPVVATVAGGIVFAGIVGAGLYYLAFPDNRTRVAVDPAAFGMDEKDDEQ